MEKMMNEQIQSTQGVSLADLGVQVIEEESEGGEELLNSNGDLLSSPRHSELSLISGSSGLLQQSQYGASRHSKEVRDPNFSNQSLGRSIFARKNTDKQHVKSVSLISVTGLQQKRVQLDIFRPNSSDALPQDQKTIVYGNYQTQQLNQLQAMTGEQFDQPKNVPDRLSQIMQRQSLPQAPITDRQRASLLMHDSMECARQGLQGAGHGHENPYTQSQVQVSRIQTGANGFNKSLTNDRNSSIQFLLSQSDKDATLTTSQNFINVADTTTNEHDKQLYLQWSLTQSAGLDSVGSESKHRQLIQQFNSQASFEPSGGLKSEDYQSQFNTANMHQKPIVVNTMEPVQVSNTPDQSLSSIQLLRGSSEKKTRPQIQHIGEEFDNILSSPSETMIEKSSIISIIAMPEEQLQQQQQQQQLANQDESSSLWNSKKDTPQRLDHETTSQDYPETTIQSPVEAQNFSTYQSKPQQDTSMLSQEQATQVPNTGKPPLSRCQSKESDFDEDDEEESGFAMISVRGNPASIEDCQDQQSQHEEANGLRFNEPNCDQRPKQHSAEQQRVQLPLPSELFGESRPSDFEQPILSAKVQLPDAIFATTNVDEEEEEQESDKIRATEFNFDFLASTAQLSARDHVPNIDYKNLPIDASNLLLQKATSLTEAQKKRVDDQAINSPKQQHSSIGKHFDNFQRLEIDHLNADHEATNEKIEQKSLMPLILTDLNMSSSSASKELNNSVYSSLEKDDFQPMLRPEELEKDPSPQEQMSQNEEINLENTDAAQNYFMPQPNDEISALLSRQTSQYSDTQSPSLVLSQTNQERMTLTSMMYTQEKQFQNNPSTGRKHYNRANFAQTSEKKGLSQHQHLPSAIFTSQSNAAAGIKEGRQQSVSSFNNTSMREGNSSNSRQSYFVNALGQRMSSDVFNKHFDPELQSLFVKGNGQNHRHQLSQIAPVEEFGRETMSSIPDEAFIVQATQPEDPKFTTATDLRMDEKVIGSAVIKEEADLITPLQSNVLQQFEAGKPDPSSLQSVTEINFCSQLDDTTARAQGRLIGSLAHQQLLSAQTIGNPGATRQMTLGVEHNRGNEDESDDTSVKRNLNLHDAFKTQMVPDQQNQQLQRQTVMYSSAAETNHHVQQLSDTEDNESAELVQSTSRPPHYSEELPLFKSHDHMGKVNHCDPTLNNHNSSQGYSLKAQQQFYRRYKHIKGVSLTASHHVKGNGSIGSEQMRHQLLGDSGMNAQPEACSICVIAGNDSHCRSKLQDSRSMDLQGGQRNQLTQSVMVLSTRENHVTQEYFAEDNEGHQETMTDDDIAVFRSQLNDIPDDLATQPIRRKFNTKASLLEQRYQTQFELTIVEKEDPIRLRMVKSASKERRSRAASLSTYHGTDEDNTGTGLDDRLSPKFEKLQQLLSMPSHQEHSKVAKNGRGSPIIERLLQRAVDAQFAESHGKSFLQRVATQQHLSSGGGAHLKEEDSTTPASLKLQAAAAMQLDCASGPLSEDDTAQPLLPQKKTKHIQHALPLQNLPYNMICQTTTHQEAKRRPSLISAMYRNDGDFSINANQTVDVRKEVLAKNAGIKERSHQRNADGIAVTQFTTKEAQNDLVSQSHAMQSLNQTQKTRQTESVPRDLQQWLSSLGLSQYGPLFVEQGLDDLQSLVQMMGSDRVLPLTHEVLEAAGIESSGHRSRILVNLELEAGVFQQNQEIMELLQTSLMSVEDVSRQAEVLFQPAGSPSQSEAGLLRPPRSEQQNNRNTPDNESRYIASPVSHSPLTEQICKGRSDQSPLRPPASSAKLSGQLSLSNWLSTHNLLFLLPIFVRSGYECLRSLILQSFSQFNSLTDSVLRVEVGIEKMGHRMRILSQLRQDALVLFQLEMLYRSAKNNAQKQSNSQAMGIPESRDQDDSLFVLPGRQQRHFKSVYSDSHKQANNSMMQQPQKMSKQRQSQNFHPQPLPMPSAQSSGHHHMSHQQRQKNSKLRTKNYSFSKGNGVGAQHSESVPSSQNTTFRQYQNQVPLSQNRLSKNAYGQQSSQSYLKEHLESNLNPCRHSTYFAQSRPIASQNSHYSGQNHPMSNNQKPHHQSQQQLPYLPKSNTVGALRHFEGEDESMVIMRQSDDQNQFFSLMQGSASDTAEMQQQMPPTQDMLMPFEQTERGLQVPSMTKSVQNAGRSRPSVYEQVYGQQRGRGVAQNNVDEKSCSIF